MEHRVASSIGFGLGRGGKELFKLRELLVEKHCTRKACDLDNMGMDGFNSLQETGTSTNPEVSGST